MTKAQVEATLQGRFEYLFEHCDTQEEADIVEWVASHMASAFNLRAIRCPWLRRPIHAATDVRKVA